MKNLRSERTQRPDPSQFWRQECELSNQSELSLQEYCGKRKISVSSLIYWRNRLGMPGKRGLRREMISLPVIEPSHGMGIGADPKGSGGVMQGKQVEIVLGELKMTLSGEISAEWLADLIGSLSQTRISRC